MKTLLLSLVLLSSLVMGACNTVHGFGRDMRSAGNWISGHTTPSDDTRVEYREYRATEY